MNNDLENDDATANAGSERTERIFFRVRAGRDAKLMRAFYAVLQAARTPAERMALAAALTGNAPAPAAVPAFEPTPASSHTDAAPAIAIPEAAADRQREDRVAPARRARKALIAIVADPEFRGPDRRAWSIAYALQTWFAANGTPCIYRALDGTTRTRDIEAIVDELMAATSASVLLIDVAWADGALDWIEAAGLLDAVDEDELSIAAIAVGDGAPDIAQELRATLGETAFVTRAQRDDAGEPAEDVILTLPAALDAELGARIREKQIALADARQAREAIGFVAGAKLARYADAVFAEFDRMARVLAP